MRGQDKEHGMSYNLKKKVETQCSLIYENQQEYINTFSRPPLITQSPRHPLFMTII